MGVSAAQDIPAIFDADAVLPSEQSVSVESDEASDSPLPDSWVINGSLFTAFKLDVNDSWADCNAVQFQSTAISVKLFSTVFAANNIIKTESS
jgi:hypothetical protein